MAKNIEAITGGQLRHPEFVAKAKRRVPTVLISGSLSRLVHHIPIQDSWMQLEVGQISALTQWLTN